MDILKPRELSKTIVLELISVIGTPTFLYFDMNLEFDEEKDLCFEAFSKPN